MDSLKAEEFNVIVITLSDFYIFNTVSLLITSFSGSNKCPHKKENPTEKLRLCHSGSSSDLALERKGGKSMSL